MKKLIAMMALLPALAVAAPQGGPKSGGPPGPDVDDAARAQMMQKRMRVARTIALAEALDLDDAGAMRARDVMARFDERRAPLRTQIMEAVRVLQDAARGDKAAAGQVDQAVKRLRDARAQMQALDGEMFQQLTQGLSPEKKAKAALFLARFQHRAHRMMMHRGHGGPWEGGGPGRGMGGPGHGMMMGGGDAPPGAGAGCVRCPMAAGGSEAMAEWFGEE
jgi:hypothetical protein